MRSLFKNFIGIGTIILLYSCSDYLEKFPIDRPSISSFLQTEEELALAVNGAYEKLWYSPNYGLPIEQHLDLASDIGWSRAFVDFQFLGNGKVDPSNSVLLSLWRHYYSAIQRTNYVLNNADKISTTANSGRQGQLVSEALVLRAYFYYHLTEMFGDVPFVVTELTLENSNVGNTAKGDIVNAILNDLESASQNLPVTYSNAADIGRITQGTALALKSRIALFNEMWDVSIDAAARVMDLPYELDDDYSALFLKEGQDASDEILFMLNYKKGVITHLGPRWIAPRMSSGFAGLIPSQSMIDSYLAADGMTIDKSPLYDPDRPYENRDPRLHYSTVVPGSIFNGYGYETHRDSITCWNYNVSPPVRVANQDALNAFASFTGYCWRKYADMRDPSYLLESETSVILIRYAEVLLNYAEAKIEANQLDQSVYDAINLVRERVDMPIISAGKSQEELRSIVRIERKSELAFEGLRLYDIRRWRIAEEVLDGPLYGRIQRGILAAAPAIDENGSPDYTNVPNRGDMRVVEVREFEQRNYLWPIPQFELDINPAVDQNDGY